MWKLRSVVGLVSLLLICSSPEFVAAQRSTNKWQTLSGDPPSVIARGGFSGIFPDSSFYAYSVAVQTGVADLVAWCDVQLTKDAVGICFPDVMLQNASNIDVVFPNRETTYVVNGVSMRGWSSVDFTLDDLANVTLKQRIFSRPPNFDGMPILTVDDLATKIKAPRLWLNVAHDAFFTQHNQSMRSFLLSVSRRAIIDYISSPELTFMRSIASRFRTTKLVFQFLRPDDVEPSTNQTYSSILSNLTSIRTFAAGILVPKNYIWPVANTQYLQNYTSLVLDAHRAGLEVFVYNFANDVPIPYDFSFDPVSEYLSFVDNGQFSVDGVLSDFPITPSETMDCFSHMGKNDTVQTGVLIISNEGASGDYPGCTDKAYEKAVSDGADILDCPVQMTSDGIPICLGSIDLRDRTNVAQSDFGNLTENNPDLNIQNGIFAYNLTWSQIQTLRPAVYNPYTNYSLFRNPRARNDGNFMQLSDFLAFASNSSSVFGVLISIENAAYLAQNQGLGVTDAVLNVLSNSSYGNMTDKKIMIRSSDSAVLTKFKSSSNYELVYLVDENVRGILNETILEIRKFASSVVISKASVFPVDLLFLTGETNIVPTLQAFNLSVYVQYFQNEFVSQPWDFFSDPYVELNTHISYMGINGVITDFPATAARFRRNRCLGYKDLPPYMQPVKPGGLLTIMAQDALPPAQPPSPVLTADDVTDPPLPPVVERPPANTGNGSTAPGPTLPNGQPKLVGSTIFGGIVALFSALMLLC